MGYPEHRDIAGTAIEGLSPARKAALNSLWEEARRATRSARLRAALGRPAGRPRLPRPRRVARRLGRLLLLRDDMLKSVLEKKWALGVARVAADLEKDLAKYKNEIDRRNWVTRSDLRAPDRGPRYSTRAGANNSHFLLARETDDVREFLIASANTRRPAERPRHLDVEHVAALRLAAAWAAGKIPGADRPRPRARSSRLEIYGVHFLEDSFAAGHVAGAGETSRRARGRTTTTTWTASTRATGPASPASSSATRTCAPSDRERARDAIGASLAQVLDALDPAWPLSPSAKAFPSTGPTAWRRSTPARAWSCRRCPRTSDRGSRGSRDAFSKTTPVPGRGRRTGLSPASAPRSAPSSASRAGSAAVMRRPSHGGFLRRPADRRDRRRSAGRPRPRGHPRGGGRRSDLPAGRHPPAAEQRNRLRRMHGRGTVAGIALQSPARKAVSVRFRMPFWLIPGDLLLAAPLVAPFDMNRYTKMAMRAASGGLIPWQAGLSTFFGRVQFILGREVGVQFFGYRAERTSFSFRSRRGRQPVTASRCARSNGTSPSSRSGRSAATRRSRRRRFSSRSARGSRTRRR